IFRLVEPRRLSVGYACTSPVLSALDERPLEPAPIEVVRRDLPGRELDPDDVNGRLERGVELVAVLGDDRHRSDLVEQVAPQVVDLGRRHLPPGEDAEVDANLERGRLLVRDREGDFRVGHQASLGCQRNRRTAAIAPTTPHARTTAIDTGSDQNCWWRSITLR